MKSGLKLTLLLLVVIIFLVAAVICHIIALATHHWLKSSSSSQADFLNIGLFVACFSKYEHLHENPVRTYDGCHKLTSDYYASIQDWLVPSWLVSCKITAIIGLILQLVSTVLLVLLMFRWFCKWACGDNERGCCERCMIYSAPITMIVAGMFLMSTVMNFADNAFRLQCKDYWVEIAAGNNADPNVNDLGYSWAFEIAACILSFLTGGFMIWLVALKAREEEIGI